MKEAILKWLHSRRHFETGVALYNTYGNNTAIKRMLAQGKSHFRQIALENALQQLIADIKPAEIPTSPTTSVTGDLPPESPSIAPKEDPDPFRDEWVSKFVEMNTLRHQLRYMATDEERGKAALRVLQLREACRQAWEKRDYFRRTGKMPADDTQVAEPMIDANMLQRRLNNLASYISKVKAKLQQHPDHAGHIAKLQQYLAEKISIEAQLQGIYNNLKDQ